PAETWWLRASGGRWRPRAVVLPPVMLPEDPARWCAHGGMGPGPRNAVALAHAALKASGVAPDCPEAMVLVVAAPVAPHAWRLPDGGVALAPGRWVRRYAALPAGARLGAWVHEMAHLLLGWPDLPGSPCLMGAGAMRDAARDPAPPGPALALAAGWMTALPADTRLPALAVDEGMALALDRGGQRLLITRKGNTFAIHDRDTPGGPLAAGPLDDLAAPLLAGAGAALASLSPAPSPSWTGPASSPVARSGSARG
ncbi:hypothetical protein, partial [Neoroseomonas soli]